MRSSKHIIRRPYVPGCLRLKDLKPGYQPLGLYSQNMDLIKKSRKFFSDFLQARSDSENAAVKSQVSSSEVAKWRAPPPLRGRAMRFTNIRGKKRKRESDDGYFYRRKNRLLNGGAKKVVTEEEMDRDDLRCRSLLQILYPELESLGIDSADWPGSFEECAQEEPDHSHESFGDLTLDLSCTLENLTIVDDDDTIMHTPYTSSEVYNDSEISWMESVSEWGDMYRSRRRHSDSSMGVPLCADVLMDALSTDSGRRSVPPKLDLAPRLTIKSIGCASPGHVPVASEDICPNELLESSAESFEPSLEFDLEATPGSEYTMEMNGEVEDVNTNASVEVAKEASWETETETEVEAETEAGFESSVGTELEETGTITSAEEANVSERADEEAEETEMEEADVSASVEEETEMSLESEGTETESADYSTEVEEAEANTGGKEADDIAEVEASEAIAEDAIMQSFGETTLETVETNMATDEPELVTSTPETVPELVPELTYPTPESAVPTEETALKLAFRTANSPANQVGNIAEYGAELCFRCQQIDMDVGGRIRAMRERMLEELLAIEQRLRPYCSGV